MICIPWLKSIFNYKNQIEIILNGAYYFASEACSLTRNTLNSELSCVLFFFFFDKPQIEKCCRKYIKPKPHLLINAGRWIPPRGLYRRTQLLHPSTSIPPTNRDTLLLDNKSLQYVQILYEECKIEYFYH